MYYFNLNCCLFCLLSIYDARSKNIDKYTLNPWYRPDATQVLEPEPQIDVKDTNSIQTHSIFKRYAVWHNGWNKRTITYKILNKPRYFWPIKSPQELSKHINKMVAKAFEEWALYCGLKFVELSGSSRETPDISISFQRGNHGDGSPFDGPDNLLAHTSFFTIKPMRAVIHFDDDELWVDVGSGQPFLMHAELYPTVMHEVGHALGLDDSADRHTIMTQSRSLDSPVTLQEDDVLGIQHIYGYHQIYPRRRPSTPKPTNPRQRKRHRLGLRLHR